ncbi:hypothetical protein A3F66_00335 [candidate division TM6 bacterium RIFCSPHIGHO2_12_FULL_32_22]|nr:MAG: hypothetical protein A3F66_00335 [candidate division TM6 bacterium RIFCSPHIGHO2_12_FULL_32_22]
MKKILMLLLLTAFAVSMFADPAVIVGGGCVTFPDGTSVCPKEEEVPAGVTAEFAEGFGKI